MSATDTETMELEFSRTDFPDDFVFGTATSPVNKGH